MTDLGATSARLKDVAADAFHGHVLPAIRREVPGLDQRIATLVTSSVAYGSADAYSDLDVFIMFRRDKDYRLWAPDLERIIESLELDAIYGDVCDKGIRFELESLHRSDLAGLFFHPYDLRRWERQTEWLLSWFLSATPIYDPAGLWLEMRRRCGTWPPPIRHQRQQVARLVARRAAAVAARTDPHDWDLPTLHRIWQGLAASVDLAYLLDGTYAPHPKWRQPLARHLLTDPRSHQLLDAFDTALTAISQPGDTATALAELEATAIGLTRAEDVSSPASAESFCWAARRDGHTTWVQHRWVPGATATLDQTVAHEDVQLLPELGADLLHRRRWDYDAAMRVSDRLRWLQRHATGLPPHRHEGPGVVRRRLRYLHFVIWRKIRVVEKAAKRRQPFNATAYALQVVDHLAELHARLDHDHVPPATQTDAYSALLATKLRPVQPHGRVHKAAVALLHAGEPSTPFIVWAWREFADLQEALVARRAITPAEGKDPLPTQFEVQYWKYETLFA